jgi:hypothetical protein
MTTARDERIIAKGKPLILQLDAAGNPSRWINYEQAAFYYAKELVAWSMGRDGMRIFGGTNRQGNRSFLDLNTIIAIRGELGDKQIFRIPSLTNRALFRRDQNICAYCGEEFAPSSLSRDHVMPRSAKGKDIWTNVVTACCSCNKRKDARTPEEAHMKLLYVPYAPNRSEYLILMNRTILADQMDFLRARVTKDSRILSPIKA